jgi:hypothetical protein
VGTTPPPSLTLHEGSPPILGGINKVKLGAACGYHATPVIWAAKKKTLPMMGGLNEIKLGQCDEYHTAPSSMENPPSIIERERGGVWTSHGLVLAITGKNPPQTMGGDKKA